MSAFQYIIQAQGGGMMNSLTKDRFLLMAVPIIFLMMIAVNALANIIPIGGMTSGQVSDAYPNLFAPIGYTFSIWSVIYTLLLAFVFFSLTSFWNAGLEGKIYVRSIIGTFIISSFFNAAWLFAWHYRVIWLSLILMFGLLGSLIRISLITRDREMPFQHTFFIKLPFDVYLGWITVATIANVTVFLVSIGWQRFGIPEDIMTALVLTVGTAIAIRAIISYRNIAFGAVIIWAYAGILAKHISPRYFNREYPTVIGTTTFLLAILGIIELVTIVRYYILHHQKGRHTN